LREHTDQLYGALLSYEGKPGDYQTAYMAALRKELDEVSGAFERLLAGDLSSLNDSLKSKGKEPISPPPAKVAVEEQQVSSGLAIAPAVEPDGGRAPVITPANIQILH
jgi:hypothetical protein